MEEPVSFGTTDYVLMALMLFISLSIGVYFAFSGRKKRTQVEYLLGGRNLGVLPVCLSLFATFNSAISLLGLPAEVYSFGTMVLFQELSRCVGDTICVFTLLPMVYPLEITSIYEYLEMRFESKGVRLLGALIGMISTISYMMVALLSPALALQTAAGLPLWISLILVGVVGTIYTAIGGMRSVVWTDVFQTVIIFGGVIATLSMACYEVGGFGKVWTKANDRGRLIFDDVSVDPRVRHTLWGLFFGGVTYWMGVDFGQSFFQRLSATKSCKHSKMVVFTSIPINLIYSTTMVITGLTLLIYFDVIGCDPLAAGYIENSNQLMPYFAIRTLGFIPGLSGLYISSIFAGALSTLSSGINSLTANTVEDLIKPCVRRFEESTVTTISKIMVACYGCAVIGLAYLVKEATGPVTQIAYTALGASNGPVLGLFLLAGIFPQANKVGAAIGCVTSLVLTMLLSVSNMLYGSRATPLPAGPVDSCQYLNNTADGMNANGTFLNEVLQSIIFHNHSLDATVSTTHASTLGPTTEKTINVLDNDFRIVDLSYVWFPFIGALITISTGLTTSLLIELFTGVRKRPSCEYLFPFSRRLWGYDYAYS